MAPSPLQWDAVITTYELCIKDAEEFLNRGGPWSYLIVDEAQRYRVSETAPFPLFMLPALLDRLKNPRSLLYRYLDKIACKKRLLMTGESLLLHIHTK